MRGLAERSGSPVEALWKRKAITRCRLLSRTRFGSLTSLAKSHPLSPHNRHLAKCQLYVQEFVLLRSNWLQLGRERTQGSV